MSSTPLHRLELEEDALLSQTPQIDRHGIERSVLAQQVAGFDHISIVKPGPSSVNEVVANIPSNEVSLSIPNQISLGHESGNELSETTAIEEAAASEVLSAQTENITLEAKQLAAEVSEEQRIYNTQLVINTQLSGQQIGNSGLESAVGTVAAGSDLGPSPNNSLATKNSSAASITPSNKLSKKPGSEQRSKSSKFLQNPRGTILDRLVGFAAKLLKKLEKRLANSFSRNKPKQSLALQAREIEKLRIQQASALGRRRRKKGYNSLRAMEDDDRESSAS